ncbi:hypothetical protein HY968_00455 [Candidatus Kaiserbacteria bacterium]|nr:hypothetical protein [Candidatus Kaiserbacteria bacterium]
MLDLLFVAILVGELVGFYFFYRSEHGYKAIYITWFAWMIDLLGIVSGTIIMSLSIFVEHHPTFFNFNIPTPLILLLFIQGSWQVSIHAVKWVLRNMVR